MRWRGSGVGQTSPASLGKGNELRLLRHRRKPLLPPPCLGLLDRLARACHEVPPDVPVAVDLRAAEQHHARETASLRWWRSRPLAGRPYAVPRAMRSPALPRLRRRRRPVLRARAANSKLPPAPISAATYSTSENVRTGERAPKAWPATTRNCVPAARHDRQRCVGMMDEGGLGALVRRQAARATSVCRAAASPRRGPRARSARNARCRVPPSSSSRRPARCAARYPRLSRCTIAPSNR